MEVNAFSKKNDYEKNNEDIWAGTDYWDCTDYIEIPRSSMNGYPIVFGGSGFGSMLMDEIRVKNGLAYSVYSYLMPYKDLGIIKIGMQTENKNKQKALNILTEQIQKFQKFSKNKSEKSCQNVECTACSRDARVIMIYKTTKPRQMQNLRMTSSA